MARLNWEAANKSHPPRYSPVETELLPIPCDASFWAVWHSDKTAMRISGYVVRKIDGRWRAYLRRPVGRPAPNLDALRKQAAAVKRKAEAYQQYRKSDAFRQRIPFQQWLKAEVGGDT